MPSHQIQNRPGLWVNALGVTPTGNVRGVEQYTYTISNQTVNGMISITDGIDNDLVLSLPKGTTTIIVDISTAFVQNTNLQNLTVSLSDSPTPATTKVVDSLSQQYVQYESGVDYKTKVANDGSLTWKIPVASWSTSTGKASDMFSNSSSDSNNIYLSFSPAARQLLQQQRFHFTIYVSGIASYPQVQNWVRSIGGIVAGSSSSTNQPTVAFGNGLTAGIDITLPVYEEKYQDHVLASSGMLGQFSFESEGTHLLYTVPQNKTATIDIDSCIRNNNGTYLTFYVGRGSSPTTKDIVIFNHKLPQDQTDNFRRDIVKHAFVINQLQLTAGDKLWVKISKKADSVISAATATTQNNGQTTSTQIPSGPTGIVYNYTQLTPEQLAISASLQNSAWAQFVSAGSSANIALTPPVVDTQPTTPQIQTEPIIDPPVRDGSEGG